MPPPPGTGKSAIKVYRTEGRIKSKLCKLQKWGWEDISKLWEKMRGKPAGENVVC
jgi:hypothetical protein